MSEKHKDEIRTINKKTGDVLWVRPHIGNNKNWQRATGFVPQPLPSPVINSEAETTPGGIQAPETSTPVIDSPETSTPEISPNVGDDKQPIVEFNVESVGDDANVPVFNFTENGTDDDDQNSVSSNQVNSNTNKSGKSGKSK